MNAGLKANLLEGYAGEDSVMSTVIEGRLAQSPEEIGQADAFEDLLLAGWVPELRPPESSVTALIREDVLWRDVLRMLEKNAETLRAGRDFKGSEVVTPGRRRRQGDGSRDLVVKLAGR